MPYLDALPAGSAGGRPARVRRILATDRARLGAAVVVAPVPFRDEGLDAAGDRVLSQVEALERAKARLESRLLEAYAALHTIQEQQLARLATAAPVPLSTERVVAAEIACATGVGQGEVSRRLELALAPRRHRVLREALRRGATSLHRALTLVAETRALPDHALPALETTVLAPAPDGTVATQQLFRARLRRTVTAADHRCSDERRRTATARRGVFGRLTEDGMGVITLTATAERVVGVLDRVDALARAARAAGDGRTLDQLRCDLLTDLALFGTTPGGHDGQALAGAASGSTAGPDAGPDAGPTCGRWLTAAPAAVVRIVVPFEVATGASDAACELPGHGWVTAAHARAIMTAPGSVWQRLAVDLDTGTAVQLSADCYTPTRAMAEHVRALDGTCRAPGCQVPAERCDLDHITPWPAGPTRVTNLQALSRGCHHPKTSGAWTARRDHHPAAGPDDRDRGGGGRGSGATRWTTLTGREYVTYPKDWREALTDPGARPSDTGPPQTGPPDRAPVREPGPEPEPPPF
jgi:hypothetical protein